MAGHAARAAEARDSVDAARAATGGSRVGSRNSLERRRAATVEGSHARRRPGPQRRAAAQPSRAGVRRLRVPVPGRHRRRGALDSRPPLRLGGEGVVGAAGRRHGALREGRARALPGAVGGARRRGVAGARGEGLGGARVGGQARGRGPVRARCDLRRAARGARGGGRAGRGPLVAAVHPGGGGGAARDAGRAARPAGAALRLAAAGRAGAGAGHLGAGRERRRAALLARRQLGPGDDPRLPRASGLRGARALAAGRPVPARAAGALPADVRRRGRAERARGAGAAAA